MPLSDIIDKFDSLTALVVGDVMIDAYLWGRVDRMSPEAPVPVVTVEKRNTRLGGAANVAKNVCSLGAKAIMVSCIGSDNSGKQLLDLLKNQGVDTTGVVQTEKRKTTVKTRVISAGKHVLRVDDEQIEDIDSELETLIIHKASALLALADVLILEDYNKGVLTERVIHELIAAARAANVPVAVDPKKKNFFAYQGVQLFKPNFKELKEGMNMSIQEGIQSDISVAAAALKKRLNNDMTFVTLSEHGVFIEHEGTLHFLDAHPRNILDVSGAGDSVIATASLCLAANATAREIAALSNLAGGIVCEQVGVVPIEKQALRNDVAKLKLKQ